MKYPHLNAPLAFLLLCLQLISHAQCSEPLPAKWPLGVNLNPVNDYDIDRPFNDIIKSSRAFSSPTSPNTSFISLDSIGWPKQDFGDVLMTQVDSSNAGVYKIRFSGNANINAQSNNYTISNKVYDTIANTTTADMTIPPTINTNSNVVISFTSTKYSSTENGIKNLQIMKPGKDFDAPLFDSTFLDHLSRFNCLRFIFWKATIGSPDSLWQNRVQPTFPIQKSTSGLTVSWEYCIRLCNQLHEDMWINIPHKADSNYIFQLAQLLKDSLDPSLHIYAEHSNEVWNNSFIETSYNKNMAIAEVNSGHSILNYDSVNDPNTWAMRRHGLRTKIISDIFKSVFGAGEVNNRFRVVYATQFFYFDYTRKGVDFINDYFGKPSNYFYGICGAPYFNARAVDSTNHGTAQQLLDGFQTYIDTKIYPTYKKPCELWAARAHFYGLHLTCYEGGPDTFGDSNIVAKAVANRSPQMKNICFNFLRNWYQYGFDGQFNWYSGGAGNWNTQYGTWSLTEHFENSMKLQAMDSVLQQATNEPTAGQVAPGTIDARKYAGYDSTTATSFTTILWKKMEEWLVRVPKDSAGTFSLKMSTATNISTLRCIVLLDDTLCDTLTLANSGNNVFDTSYHGIHFMNEGYHTIRVKYIGGTSFKIKDFIFERQTNCVNISTGTSETTDANGVTVFPNPASQAWNVQSANEIPANTNIQLLDITGKELRNIKSNLSLYSFTIDNTLLAAGVYFLRIGNQTIKLVKE